MIREFCEPVSMVPATVGRWGGVSLLWTTGWNKETMMMTLVLYFD